VSHRRSETRGQVARFGLVGVLNTVLDYVLFITFTIVFRIPLDQVWIAKYPSSAIAMVVSFALNRRFVFRSRRPDVMREVFRFVTATLVGVFVIQNLLTQFFSSDFQYFGTAAYRLAAAVGLSAAQVDVHGRTLGVTESFTIKTVAFGLATVASLTWNFVAYKYWAFRQDDEA
jgi:putative flippase GtrA